MASPGKELITVFEPGDLRVVANVPQYKLAEVKQTLRARVELPESGRWIDAASVTLLPTADARTHSVRVRVNLPVLTPEGLVGRVAGVSFDHAQVLLVGDPNCRVAALVENENRDNGVVGPAGPLENDLAVLSYLPRGAALKPGQAVLTSGLGGVFPKGLLLGKIVDAQAVEYGLYLEARVKLAANLNALEEVWVLLP